MKIANKLNEVLSDIAPVLSEIQQDDIRIYISAGEWLLALETLCEFLIEDEFPITLKTYLLFQEIEDLMGGKCLVNKMEYLKEQIQHRE